MNSAQNDPHTAAKVVSNSSSTKDSEILFQSTFGKRISPCRAPSDIPAKWLHESIHVMLTHPFTPFFFSVILPSSPAPSSRTTSMKKR